MPRHRIGRAWLYRSACERDPGVLHHHHLSVRSSEGCSSQKSLDLKPKCPRSQRPAAGRDPPGPGSTAKGEALYLSSRLWRNAQGGDACKSSPHFKTNGQRIAAFAFFPATIKCISVLKSLHFIKILQSQFSKKCQQCLLNIAMKCTEPKRHSENGAAAVSAWA